MKYSDLLCDWLADLGYTHGFFVAGGNIMHLLESASRRFTMIPVVHEVAGGIAAEYFNESGLKGRAFALVTAGPGFTNLVTALAGAWLESRELLVIGGQVKVPDLAHGQLRQRGIQEIDGVAIAKPLCVRAERLDAPLDRAGFTALAEAGSHGRKGPVFIEMPLDVQGRTVDVAAMNANPVWRAVEHRVAPPPKAELDALVARLKKAERPVILLGGGVSRATAAACRERFAAMGVPLMTTWNGADRIAADHPLYFGRPNTWGQRYANLLLQQADVVVALGTRLGMQQTGFNWQEFAAAGEVIQIDCDAAELEKGHPKLAKGLCGDANAVLEHLAAHLEARVRQWIDYCREVQRALPLVEAGNTTGETFLSPYAFATQLSGLCTRKDLIVPCSSGSAFTVMMQTFAQKAGQVVITNKGLASMGYGLSGAIGLALAGAGQRTVLVEGDGGFAQNLQELGTVAANRLNLKIFIFDDNGYASIRMTQRNYFGGRYVGCDLNTGLGLPAWEKLFAAYDIPVRRIGPGFESDPAFLAGFDHEGPAAFLVTVDPEQTYFPKITSRVAENGGMVSNPLHQMTPLLDDAQMARLGRYLPRPS